jgi:hypothetical protein
MPSPCQIVKQFSPNNKFKFVGGDESCFTGGRLKFAEGDEKQDGCYKSYVLPSFFHSGVVYQSDLGGLESAFNYRLACAREPQIPGYHDFLLNTQASFFRNDAGLSAFKIAFSQFVKQWFADFGCMDEELIKYAERPHPKRKLRLRALKSILDSGDLFHRTLNRRVTGKVKRAELAKNGKATRLINDLTCEGSLLAGFVADQLKQAMAQFTSGQFFQFIKSPNLDLLKTTFDKLMDPEGDMFFPFFFDDSCVSIRCLDGLFMANVDISSCDGSHGKVVFDLLRYVTRTDSRLFRYVDGAIKQCEMNLTLVAGTGQKVILKPNAPTLYSGSTLTTLINNFANIAIAHSIKSRLHHDLMRSDCEELIRLAAESAGYIVTVQVCDTYHGLQFLKHSPCKTACGAIVPVLNLGVIMRSLGCCWGDLPPYPVEAKLLGRKLTFAERAYLYNTSQVQCYKNGATHSFLAALRKRFHHDRDIVYTPDSFTVDSISGDFSAYVVDDSELAIRYNVSPEDFRELSESIEHDAMINIVASRAVLSLDYGL